LSLHPFLTIQSTSLNRYPRLHIAENRATPNDELFSEQLALEIINMESAWNLSTGGLTSDGKEIVIAVIDDGFDLTHIDLVDNIWNNQYEIPGDNLDNDGNGYTDDIQGIRAGTITDDHPLATHGNWVLGTIGAKGDNTEGVAGVNWTIKMMPITSSGSLDQIYESYSYVLDQRMRYNSSNGMEGSYVVATNASFGIENAYAENYPIWCELYDLLGAQGVLSVGATSNSYKNVDVVGDMPSTCSSPYLITVTTTDEENGIDAGYGSQHVDIVAPGNEGYTTTINNQYRTFSGTSSATPMVAGAIGLMYSLDASILNTGCNPDILAITIKQIILNNVNPVSTFENITTSGGLLDVAACCDSLIDLSNSSEVSGDLLSICSFSSGPLTSRLLGSVSNPANTDYEILVHNDAGQLLKVLNRSEENDLIEVDLTDLSQGLYFLSVLSSESKLTRKFIKI